MYPQGFWNMSVREIFGGRPEEAFLLTLQLPKAISPHSTVPIGVPWNCWWKGPLGSPAQGMWELSPEETRSEDKTEGTVPSNQEPS